jgi:hypothetical protein
VIRIAKDARFPARIDPVETRATLAFALEICAQRNAPQPAATGVTL